MTQTTLRDYLRATEDAISSGRIEEAMANCQNILAYFPEALEAQRLLGEVYLAQGQLEEARQTFEWILTNDPENVIVYCDRALISERTSDIDTALDCYQQAYELSRGNANIRQEFNQLSARAGQPEFMFSRAGLARLYMRGDLLTQARQEWDAVLELSPDRLDARLGLMETYWREGLYQKAEEVATHLLEDVPTCLKALLFLAHIASISNMQRARDLLQRAETLDPELSMAQELFADLAAAQPGDPFLALLKKEPILLDNGRPRNLAAAPTTDQASQPAPTPRTAEQLYDYQETLETWDQPTRTDLAHSQPLPTVPAPQHASNGHVQHAEAPELSPTRPEISSSSTWSEPAEPQAPAAPDQAFWPQQETTEIWSEADDLTVHPAWLDTLTRGEQPSAPPTPLAAAAPEAAAADLTSRSTENAPTPADSLASANTPSPVPPSADVSEDAPVLTHSSTTISTPEIPPTPTQASAATEHTPQTQTGAEEFASFFFTSTDDDENDMGWPEWLKSLGAETLEPEQSEPSAPPPEAIPPTPVSATATETPDPETSQPRLQEPEPAPTPAAPSPNPWDSLPALSAENDAQETPNDHSDWIQPNQQPAWMKQVTPLEIPDSDSDSALDPQDPNPTFTWEEQVPPAPAPANHLSTREEAESSAMPDWMQQFASTQNTSSTPEEEDVSAMPDWMRQFSPARNTISEPEKERASAMPDWMQQFADAPTQNPYQQTEAPGWLQQLTNPSNQPAPEPEPAASTPIDEQEQHYLNSLESLEQSLQSQGFLPLEPGTLASLAQGQGAPPTQPQPENPPSLSSALAQLGNFTQKPGEPESQESWWNAEQASPAIPRTPSEPLNPFAALGARPNNETASPFAPLPATPAPAPFAPAPEPPRADRPLTPTFQTDALLDDDLETTMKRPAITLQPMKTGQTPGTRSNSRGLGHGERYPVTPPGDQNLSYHEHLIRGYQYQLNGAYEEAMQEYRLVIRNAPELLDDVISNLRALLKITPRFSLGHRVLGDAYMRKGEYLQAMESYNKALTMAKKARG